ncbi:MAG TPA: hypothetical protein VFV38_18860 [Ktedonobacteraceae bacterium]|nr:hypothetical protein [Ktedonobacteraceae bacterium]
MSESQRTVVQCLLLSAPKERRLDLAIASVLSTVRKEYVEVVLLGQRQVVPVSFFVGMTSSFSHRSWPFPSLDGLANLRLLLSLLM